VLTYLVLLASSLSTVLLGAVMLSQITKEDVGRLAALMRLRITERKKRLWFRSAQRFCWCSMLSGLVALLAIMAGMLVS